MARTSAPTHETPESAGITDLALGIGNDSPDGRGVLDSKSILGGGDLIDPRGGSILKGSAELEEDETRILDDLEQKHGIELDDDDRDARGRFKEKQEGKKKEKTEVRESDEEPASEDAEERVDDDQEPMTDEQRDEYRKAVHALLRDQVDWEDIEEFTPDQILRLGGKAAKRQADSQARWQAQQRKGEAPGGRAAEANGSAEPAAQPAVTTPPTTGFEPLAELLGEDEARALSAAQQAQIEPLREAIGVQAKMIEQMVLRGVRSDLAEEYGDVVKGRGWREVMDEMKVLADNGYSTDPFEIGETACKIVRASKGPRIASDETIDRRRRGAVRTVSKKGDSARKPKLSDGDRVTGFLDDLEAVHMFGKNTRGLTALEYATERAGRR